jgi:hypothetical protein
MLRAALRRRGPHESPAGPRRTGRGRVGQPWGAEQPHAATRMILPFSNCRLTEDPLRWNLPLTAAVPLGSSQRFRGDLLVRSDIGCFVGLGDSRSPDCGRRRVVGDWPRLTSAVNRRGLRCGVQSRAVFAA